MSKKDVQDAIEKRSRTNIRIAPELADICEFLITNGYVPGGPAIKTADLTSRCPEASYYRLKRLHEEMGMVMKYKKNVTYLIHRRIGDIVNGQGVSSMVNDELKLIAQHAKSDPSIRRVVASVLGIPPSKVPNGLWAGGFATRQKRLVEIIEAIQRDPYAKQGNYGKIVFRNSQNRYRATSLGTQIYNK